MMKNWDPSQELFNKLLEWLDSDRDAAAEKYEAIRRRLIKIFTCRGCNEAEDLADETINRVTFKVTDLVQSYTGEPALFFYGVAQKVHFEYLRKPKPTPPLPTPDPNTEEVEKQHECLDGCMEKLTGENRELVLRYYGEEKQAKIDNRRQLAEELGIAVNALRIRAFRIRRELYECVRHCLEQQPAH